MVYNWKWHALSNYDALLRETIRTNENVRLRQGTGIEGTSGDGHFYVEKIGDDKPDRLAIGYGYDLTSRDFETVKKQFNKAGITLLELPRVGSKLPREGLESQALRTYLNGPKLDADTSRVFKTLSNIQITEAQANSLLTEDLPGFEKQVDKRSPITVDKSKERVALVSLAYNKPSLIGPNLKNALKTANRPGAWAEIRYFSNGNAQDESVGEGLQNRRFRESDLFGLSQFESNEAGYKSERLNLVDYLDRRREIIAGKSYVTQKIGKKPSKTIYFRKDIEEKINGIRNDVIAFFKPGMAVDSTPISKNGVEVVQRRNVFVGVDASSWLDDDKKLKEADNLTGTGKDDLLIGQSGNDKINGGGGQDTAGFLENCSEYDFKENRNGTWTVTHARGTKQDGTDTLKDIEFVGFKNGTFKLEKGKIPCAGQDIGFIIDTTGSMSSYIGQVIASASIIINAIFDDTTGQENSRIGIVGYKDPGELELVLEFTGQEDPEARKTAALEKIKQLRGLVGGGGDVPEGIYSGLQYALKGGLGDWRADASVRRLIVFGDAPPKDTELADTVNQLARNLNAEISIQTLSQSPDGTRVRMSMVAAGGDAKPIDVEIFTVVVGSNRSAQEAFKKIADEGSGQYFTAANANGVVDALLAAITAESFETATAPDPINFRKGEKGLRLRGTNRANKLSGTSGNDRMTGLKGKDRLMGDRGNDRLDGGDGDDLINGGEERDLLLGGLGNDSLIGGSGDDILVGGLGFDTLRGGSGIDMFVFNSLSEANDTILDFSATEDLIDIRQIVASPEFANVTSLGGFNAVVNLLQVGSDTAVRIDQDGNNSGTIFATLATLRNVLVKDIGGLNFVVS